ncbi:piggyBac transposable element-derived protein 4-like [Huso huso]|uniref:PiggyBac transposable element-derived protein 4-like n=1 Tax=Huso huso TaxID=61971 RepID=A0ABR0YHG4_HUSHU
MKVINFFWVESADSMSEAAFEDGLDPLQDFEDTEENPPPSTSESFDVSQQKSRRSIPTPLPYITSSMPARPVESRRASTPTPTTSDPEERWKSVTEDRRQPVQHRFVLHEHLEHNWILQKSIPR